MEKLRRGTRGLIPNSDPDVQQSDLPEVSFRAKIKGNGNVVVIITKKKNNSFRVSFAGKNLRPSHQLIDVKISRVALEDSIKNAILKVNDRVSIASLNVIQIRRILNI